MNRGNSRPARGHPRIGFNLNPRAILPIFFAFCLDLNTPCRIFAATGDPLAGETAAMRTRGYEVERILSAKEGKIRLAAVLYRETAGEGYHRLRVYSIPARGKPVLTYLEMAAAVKIELASAHADGGFSRLFDKTAPYLIYTKSFPGMGQKQLIVLRYHRAGSGGHKGTATGRKGRGSIQADRWLPVPGSPFPDGTLRDLDGDGVPEIVSKSLPLGPFFSVECRDFRSMAQSAFQTRIYRWENGRFIPASRRFRAYFDAEIAQLSGELASNDPRQTQDYGGALGTALAIYFDYAEEGRQRDGWAMFSRKFSAAGQLPPVTACIRKIKGNLRSRLGIPDDWPD